MGVQVMCAGSVPGVSAGRGAGERLLNSGIFGLTLDCKHYARAARDAAHATRPPPLDTR
jgi:hypothetical protein